MTTPGELEVFASYRRHLGPRYEAAGVRLQFHYNQVPGIHLRAEVPVEYRDAIVDGIETAMSRRYPGLLSRASVWVVEIVDDEVDSSPVAFRRAAEAAIEQAYFLASTNGGSPER